MWKSKYFKYLLLGIYSNKILFKNKIKSFSDCEYNPCEGKELDQQCHLCDPEDKNCVETLIVKTCQYINSELICL